jgi:hypothetical protein
MRKEIFVDNQHSDNKKLCSDNKGLCFSFCLNFGNIKYIVVGIIVGLLICHYIFNHMQTKNTIIKKS